MGKKILNYLLQEIFNCVRARTKASAWKWLCAYFLLNSGFAFFYWNVPCFAANKLSSLWQRWQIKPMANIQCIINGAHFTPFFHIHSFIPSAIFFVVSENGKASHRDMKWRRRTILINETNLYPLPLQHPTPIQIQRYTTPHRFLHILHSCCKAPVVVYLYPLFFYCGTISIFSCVPHIKLSGLFRNEFFFSKVRKIYTWSEAFFAENHSTYHRTRSLSLSLSFFFYCYYCTYPSFTHVETFSLGRNKLPIFMHKYHIMIVSYEILCILRQLPYKQ